MQPSTAYTYDESTCILSIYSDDFDRDDIERFALNNAYKTINQLKEQLEEFQLQVNNELTSLNQKYTDIETNLEVFANNI